LEGSSEKEIFLIRPEMTILEIVQKYSRAQDVFKKYNEQIGQCLMCIALFESLSTVSERFGLNLKKLLQELEAAVR
jgi:hypothetical protein